MQTAVDNLVQDVTLPAGIRLVIDGRHCFPFCTLGKLHSQNGLICWNLPWYALH